MSYGAYREWAMDQNADKVRGAFNEIEQEYIEMLVDNAKYGIEGLTVRQAIGGADEILSAVHAGDVTTLLANTDQGVVDAYMQVYKNMPAFVSMAQAVEEMGEGFDIRDLENLGEDSYKYQKIDAKLRAMGFSAEEAKRTMEDLDQEVFIYGVTALNAYGDSTEEVVAAMELLSGSAEEATQALHNLFDAMYQIEDLDYLTAMWKEGVRSNDVVSGVAAALGMSEEDVLKAENEDYVSSRLAAERNVKTQKLQTQISAYDQYLSPTLVRAIRTEDGGINVDK